MCIVHSLMDGWMNKPANKFQIKQVLDEILEKLPDPFNMVELMSKVEPADRTPYVVVAFQECERMSGLISEIRYRF